MRASDCRSNQLGGRIEGNSGVGGSGAGEGADQLPEDPAQAETQSIFKAPQPDKAQTQLLEGYEPQDFSMPGGDDRAYFAKDKSLADEFAQHYGEGVIEVVILRSLYNARLKKHEQLYQEGPEVELPIPHEDFDVLNNSVRKLHE
jgi:hypothetical protein